MRSPPSTINSPTINSLRSSFAAFQHDRAIGDPDALELLNRLRGLGILLNILGQVLLLELGEYLGRKRLSLHLQILQRHQQHAVLKGRLEGGDAIEIAPFEF